MRILVIDTALEACAAGVLDAPEAILAVESVAMVGGHAEALMPLLARVMDAAAVGFSELDRIAVTVGPGSFTGLRVGIAAGRGIALATGKPVVGISTLAAFAAPHLASGEVGPVVAAVDARHGQVYLQAFGPGGRTLVTPRLLPITDAIRCLADVAVIVGTGADLFAAHWPEHVRRPAIEQRPAPDVASLGRLGALADPALALPKPLYLRSPDARPQGAARLPRR